MDIGKSYATNSDTLSKSGLNLKNKGSIIAKLNAAIASVSSAIENLNENNTILTQNNIDTTVNELNALINFISSQDGKSVPPELAREAYKQFNYLIFLLNLAKSWSRSLSEN